MTHDRQHSTSFLHRLLHDVTANTLAIAAAAMVPLMAMVGGGVDASRYYMAAARMQAACDAGALAARRAMPTDTFTSAHRQIGLNFFDQNFNDGIFGTEGRTRNYTSDGNGEVQGTASATLPTTIMGAFGYTEFNLSVSCTADINISNSDIMFVLDVTGSMADCPNNSKCNSGPGSKIVALRSAVMNFYDTVESATSANAQVRYGFVPYSQQVNVGALIPRSYMATRHSYQSRVPRFQVGQVFVPGNGIKVGDTIQISNQSNVWITRLTSNLGSLNQADYYYNNNSTNANSVNTADRTRCQSTNRGTFAVGSETWTISSTTYVLNQYKDAPLATRAGCRGTVRRTRLATEADVIPDRYDPQIQFLDYRYCQLETGASSNCSVSNPAGSPAGWESVNLSTLYTNNTISLPTGNLTVGSPNFSALWQSHTWSGCIEEPVFMDTSGNYSPIPDDAYDLNINLVPSTEAQRFKPALNNAVWRRRDASNNDTVDMIDSSATTGTQFQRPGWACPRAARRLAELTRSDLQSYVNDLQANGNTYHDIGMLWGARLISPRGMFAADNATAPNGDAIARHIVFMTDGEQFNVNTNYTPQGVEWWDRRISGTGDGTTEFNRRAARLQAICNAAEQENITIWVVAFGTALTQNLRDCASPGRAFQASDSATLNARFQEIAQKIAALRLTQ
jgi:Flp pilus assembly protein TadG